jgi:hypothetical protein
MPVKSESLVVCQYVAASPPQVVDFWSRYYSGRDLELDNDLYTRNINGRNGRHTARTLTLLFQWKVGNPYFESVLPRLQRQFVSRRADAYRLPAEPNRFFAAFPKGGAIYRIFWLHCWHPKFPIFDQHVYRAMTYIREARLRELAGNDNAKLDIYLKEYIPFHREFDGIDGRLVDRALFSFGKHLKSGRPPPS